jgi:predicted acyltransferase
MRGIRKSEFMTPEINIAKYVEHLVFGQFDDAPSAYNWFLGSLGFVATVMTGVFAITIIRSEKLKIKWITSPNMLIQKTYALVVVGLALVICGQLANIWSPIIKHIWNPSFVLFSSGLCFLLMELFYYIIDVKGHQRWAFWLKVIGMNSIAIYMAVQLIDFSDIAQHIVFGFEQFFQSYYAAFQTVVRLGIEYGILYYLYKKGTFIKVSSGG